MSETIADKLNQFASENEKLAATLTAKGVPAQGGEGLVSLAEKVKRINQHVANGMKTPVRVSSVGGILAGDFVTLTSELWPVEERKVDDGANLIASGFAGKSRCVLAFTKGGKLYVKAVKRETDGTIALGNSLQIAETAPDNAVLVGMTDAVAVIYPGDAGAYAAWVTLDGLTGALAYTGIADVDAPVNLTACALADRTALLCCTHQTDGKSYAMTLGFGDGEVTVGPETELAPDFEQDEYMQAWSVAALSGRLAMVGYFRDHDTPLQYLVLAVSGDTVTQKYAGEYLTKSALPCVAVAAVNGNCCGVAGAAARTADSGETEALLTFEGWRVLPNERPQPMWWGEEDHSAGGSISQVSLDMMGEAHAVLSCVLDGTLYAAVVETTDHCPESGATVSLGACAGYARLWALNENFVIGAVERADGVYACLYRREQAVIRAEDHNDVDGLAEAAAAAGEACMVYLA